MTDIVWNLRNDVPCNGDIGCAWELCHQAAEEIERLRAALRDCLSWHDYSNDMHKPIEVRAAYMRARAALEGKHD